MSKALKVLFLVHAVVATLAGAVMLFIPGRFLQWLGWTPIDPVISRLLGAALLALAWSSLYGWQATQRSQVAVLIQMETVFTVLACVGLVRHLVTGYWSAVRSVVLGLFAVFAIAWIVFLIPQRE